MQEQRRTFERMNVDMNIKFFCEQSLYTANMTDCTKNGIGINTFCNCLPCSYKVDLLVPLNKEILRLKGKISRIKKINDIHYNIGIEIVKPPQKYLGFCDSLSNIHTA